MAGVEEAKAGMLGLSAGALGVGVALAGAVIFGKAAAQNYKSQEEATNSLKQATDAYNLTVGTTTTTVKESADAIAKAQDVATAAGSSLTFAYSAQAAAQMHYTAAVKAHGPHSEQAILAGSQLLDVNIRMKAAIEANADAQQKLTDATATVTTEVYHQSINLDSLKAKYAEFKSANAGFISDQYDTETALAAIVRSGENETDAIRILNDALDLAAIKHETVGEAAKSLDLALAGQGKSLKELGITTDEYTAIMHNKTLTTEERHLALLKLIESKTKDGRDIIDSTTQSQNKLTIAWQDFTAKTGPDVLAMWRGITDAAATGLGILELTVEAYDKIARLIHGAVASSFAPGSGSATQAKPKGYAVGGPISGDGGEDYLVGEQGPEIRHFGAGGSIIPGGGGGAQIHIHIDRGAYIDGPSIDYLANAVALRLGYATGR